MWATPAEAGAARLDSTPRERDGAQSAVELAWEAIEAQSASRDAWKLAAHPLPTSLAEWTARASLAVVFGVASLWTFTLLLHVTNSTALVLLMSAALAACGPLVARLNVPAWLRWAAWSWCAVLAGLSLALVITEIVYRLR